MVYKKIKSTYKVKEYKNYKIIFATPINPLSCAKTYATFHMYNYLSSRFNTILITFKTDTLKLNILKRILGTIYLNYFGLVRALLLARKPVVAYTYENLFLIGLFCKLLGKKWIHDVVVAPHQAIEFSEMLGTLNMFKKIVFKILKILYKSSFHYCDLVIARNRFLKENLIKEYMVDNMKILELPLGVDTSLFTPNYEPVQRNYLRIAYSGVISSFRGIDILFKAVSLSAKKIPVEVILIGKGSRKEVTSLKRLAEALKISSAIKWKGYLSEPIDVYQLLRESDVLLIPTPSLRVFEMNPSNKLMVYLAMGGVIVASDIEPHRQFIRDGWNGFLFPPEDYKRLADLFQEIYKRRHNMRVMKERARRIAETYDWQKILSIFEKKLNELLF